MWADCFPKATTEEDERQKSRIVVLHLCHLCVCQVCYIVHEGEPEPELAVWAGLVCGGSGRIVGIPIERIYDVEFPQCVVADKP